MDSSKIYKILVAVLSCGITISGIVFGVSGCQGVSLECKGSYCIKKV